MFGTFVNAIRRGIKAKGSALVALRRKLRRENGSWCRRWFAGLGGRAWSCLWLTACFGVGGGAQAGNGLPLTITADSFESWMHRPGPFDTLVFSRTLHEYPVAFESQDEMKRFMEDVFHRGQGTVASRTEYFALRFLDWEHWMIQQLSDSNATPWQADARVGTFAGRQGTHWWIGGKTGFQCLESHSGTYEHEGTTLAPHATYGRMASEVLRLGLYEIDPTTVRLVGKEAQSVRFRARGFDDRAIVEGRVRLQQGLVHEIEYDLGNGSQPAARKVRLIHDSTGLRQIQVYTRWQGKSDWDHYATYGILQWCASSVKLLSTGCEQFLLPTDFHVVAHQDGERVVLQHPNWQGGRSAPHVSSVWQSTRVRPWLVAILVACSVSTLVVLLYRENQKARFSRDTRRE